MKNQALGNWKDSLVVTYLLPPGSCVSLDQVGSDWKLLLPGSQGEKRWWCCPLRFFMNCWPQYKDPGLNNVRRLIVSSNSDLGIIPFDRGGEAIALRGKLASPSPVLFLLYEKRAQADLQPIQIVRVWVMDFRVITTTDAAEEAAQQSLYTLMSAWRFLWALHIFLKYGYCRWIGPAFKVTKCASQTNCIGFFFHSLTIPDFKLPH